MKSILTCFMACMMSLAWPPIALAASHAYMHIADQPAPPAVHSAANPAPVAAVKTRNRRAPRARLHKEVRRNAMRPAHAPHATLNVRKPDRSSLAAAIRNAEARGADARDATERDARAERLYRSSQLSTPIIPDAKACKRIGAHGESIYENC